MAFSLPLPSQSLIRRSVSDTQCHQSCMAAADCLPIEMGDRQTLWSTYHKSLTSLAPTAGYAADEKNPPQSPSRSFLSIFKHIDLAAMPEASTRLSRKSSWSTCFSESSRCSGLFVVNGTGLEDDTEFGEKSIIYEAAYEKAELSDPSDKGEEQDKSSEIKSTLGSDALYNIDKEEPSCNDAQNRHLKSTPFKRWMSTLRRRNGVSRGTVTAREERWVLDDFDKDIASDEPLVGDADHKRSKSGTSSLQIIKAVTSASVTLASTSIAQMSRRDGMIARVKSENRSSRLSANRGSLDSTAFSVSTSVDYGALTRSVQRRNILEEVISSERGYIGDLRALESVSQT